MNLILLSPEDFIDADCVRLAGRQFEHITSVQRAEAGESLTVGVLGGKMGRGTITAINDSALEMTVTLNQEPPAALPLTLIVALPRPKMLKRILQTIATMGVKKLIFINSVRVEKSYWQTPILQEAKIREHLILGLEQARDTIMPEVILAKRFKPFVEDTLPSLINSKRALIAHPGLGCAAERGKQQETVLAVGPEGGFIEYEVNKLLECGFEGIHLGDRILRVETAIPVLLAKLF